MSCVQACTCLTCMGSEACSWLGFVSCRHSACSKCEEVGSPPPPPPPPGLHATLFCCAGFFLRSSGNYPTTQFLLRPVVGVACMRALTFLPPALLRCSRCARCMHLGNCYCMAMALLWYAARRQCTKRPAGGLGSASVLSLYSFPGEPVDWGTGLSAGSEHRAWHRAAKRSLCMWLASRFQH